MNGFEEKETEGHNKVEISSYIPSEEQLRQVETLGGLIEQCKQEGVDICVAGGYGLDALYGSLTRDHGDVDLFVDDKGIEVLRRIVLGMGFVEDTEDTDKIKNLFRPGEHSNLPKTFKIEFAAIGSYIPFLPENTSLESIFPKEENASLAGFSLKTPTLEGQKIILNAQKKRADDAGWTGYKYYGHNEAVLKAIEDKNKK